MQQSPITWIQDRVAGVALRRFTAHVGSVEVGAVAYDGSNRLWTWSSPLSEDARGHAPSEAGAKQAFEVWLRGWLEAFSCSGPSSKLGRNCRARPHLGRTAAWSLAFVPTEKLTRAVVGFGAVTDRSRSRTV